MAKKETKITPAMRQFHHFKEKYPDAVLFFRMGDFYETFYEDAATCSKVLGLTLTSRGKDSGNPIPLAGVPYHAVDGYLKKMIKAGYKVAVCEQVEDPKQAKGVVRRDVVRVVTPGTLTDEMLLEDKRDNFLAAVSLSSGMTGIAWVDISTGHFYCRAVDESKVLDELLRIGASECLLPDMKGSLFESAAKKLRENIVSLAGATVTERPGWYFEPQGAKKKMLKHFGVQTLEGFGFTDSYPAIEAAGAVLEYLSETQKTALTHIKSVKKVDPKATLELDQTTLRSLEVLRTIRSESSANTLFDNIDATLTGMGGRLLQNWICAPLCDVEMINERHQAVAQFTADDALCGGVRNLLKSVADIERIVARISTYRTSPRDLVALCNSLKQVPPLREMLSPCSAALLKELANRCDSMDELAELLTVAIEDSPPVHLRDGGVIKAGFNEQLDRYRSLSKDNREFLAQYQQAQAERTGIDKLKIGFNKVFGYYIEVPRWAADDVPGDYHRKQTIKNAERYITDELKKYETEVLTAQEKSLELEYKLFDEVRDFTAKFISRLQDLAHTVAVVDCLACFGHIARDRGWVRPVINDTKELYIEQGKHPVLDDALGNAFVPNDTLLGGPDSDLAIITGPNMAGKSTYIRQVALLVILAQAGSFLPAKEARIGVVDRVFTRVGASDELARGLSTFMVEMTETANIVNNATQRSLVVLDEVGRGTSTYDGLALAWSITEHIANEIKCRTLFATHYHQLTELAEILSNVVNLNVAVREWMDEVVFLHKILPGGTDKSYGLHVAKLAGIPPAIIDRGREVLNDLEQTFTREAAGEKLARKKTADQTETLFTKKQRSVLERLKNLDVNNLTPIEAINLLSEVKKEVGEK